MMSPLSNTIHIAILEHIENFQSFHLKRYRTTVNPNTVNVPRALRVGFRFYTKHEYRQYFECIACNTMSPTFRSQVKHNET
jgi:hypothetical protein